MKNKALFLLSFFTVSFCIASNEGREVLKLGTVSEKESEELGGFKFLVDADATSKDLKTYVEDIKGRTSIENCKHYIFQKIASETTWRTRVEDALLVSTEAVLAHDVYAMDHLGEGCPFFSAEGFDEYEPEKSLFQSACEIACKAAPFITVPLTWRTAKRCARRERYNHILWAVEDRIAEMDKSE